ncbi:hypothetical protein TBLA_0A05400 [Henningerozyma blattae CBS 6284]|uniref:SUN-like protein 1 n=1 Tax=Henningerozyma blattae (strain ATCC 34711 / CBS 6284 / DSM 70876 / NBRC 10599 / NRRL Y-10934 / UCD 77-7) TaxID=1071380 RepID=I2GW31_HENB6|nr:hypothetical protein TBLA_0A05400 [Tetrapisispora blattae CBS 6284]CCH58333.1 hypothetical protein TBLA_0A05400 [Tetrapisispora blattae CBS 6284]
MRFHLRSFLLTFLCVQTTYSQTNNSLASSDPIDSNYESISITSNDIINTTITLTSTREDANLSLFSSSCITPPTTNEIYSSKDCDSGSNTPTSTFTNISANTPIIISTSNLLITSSISRRKLDASYLIQSGDINLGRRTDPFPHIFDEINTFSDVTNNVSEPLDDNQNIESLPHLKPDDTQLLDSDKESSPSNHSANTFLSFDEWKKAKVDQDLVLKEAKLLRTREPGSLASTSNDGKNYGIGEEAEIDLGFLTSNKLLDDTDEKNTEDSEELEGKIYKDKFNFASFDCAATIVKTNSEASGATSILFENKDTYLLNPCSANNKFVVIELCQDILVEEIVLGNFEFFSSTFHNIRFLVSDTFPPKSGKNGWIVLGEFEAENSRNLQKFTIDKPQIWARFLKIEILSHYDNEFYCPISLVRTHGKTMMDELKMSNNQNQINKEQGDSKRLEETVNAELSVKENNMHIDDGTINYYGKQNGCGSNKNVFAVPKISNDSNSNSNISSCQKQQFLRFETFLNTYNIDNKFCDQTCERNITSTSTVATTALTEESVFQNIIKRLNILEKNSTLSALYIEEQSQLLFKAFEQLEKSYTSKLGSTIESFNKTLLKDLNSLKVFATDLKDLSVRLLEEQKLANLQSLTENHVRLESLENDLSSIKRITYILMLVLLALVSYILLSKDTAWDEATNDDEWLHSNFTSGPKILKKSKSKQLFTVHSFPTDFAELTSLTSSNYEKSIPDNSSLPEFHPNKSPKPWSLNNLSDTDMDEMSGFSSGVDFQKGKLAE